MKIGEKLQSLREREGYTRKDFAEEIKLSPHSLLNYENRGRDVPASVLYKITNHPKFRKYTLWLMIDDDSPERFANEQVMGDDEFSVLLSELNTDQLTQLLKFMEFLVSENDAKK